MRIAQTRITLYFDRKYKSVILEGQVYIKVRQKPRKIGYKILKNTSLSPIKMGSFKIIKKVDSLAYRLDLFKRLRIHPVISVIYLK